MHIHRGKGQKEKQQLCSLPWSSYIYRRALRLALVCVYVCSAFPAARGIPFEQMQTNGCLRYVHSIDRLGRSVRSTDRPRECMQTRAPPPSQRSYNAAGANDVRNRERGGTHPLTAFFYSLECQHKQ
jgi:hypothetical protein